jgi:hypothetical protein
VRPRRQLVEVTLGLQGRELRLASAAAQIQEDFAVSAQKSRSAHKNQPERLIVFMLAIHGHPQRSLIGNFRFIR